MSRLPDVFSYLSALVSVLKVIRFLHEGRFWLRLYGEWWAAGIAMSVTGCVDGWIMLG